MHLIDAVLTVAGISRHGPWNAFLAALTARSISAASPSATWQISLPVLQGTSNSSSCGNSKWR